MSLVKNAEIEAYARQGVSCLRDVFDARWTNDLGVAIQRCMDAPGPMAADFNTEPGDRRFFGDMFMSQSDPVFRRAALDSPAAQIAATIMAAGRVHFFYDQAFVKEPGAAKRTPWHQDMPYWPVAGRQITTVWIALDPVTYDSGAVEFISGSHLGDTIYRPVPFGAPNAINKDYENSAYAPVPDIEANRDAYEILSFEMMPGDCLLFDGRIVHGAPGNISKIRRRGLTLRYLGDDVRYDPRPGTFPLPRDPGLEPGAEMECDLFPLAWPT